MAARLGRSRSVPAFRAFVALTYLLFAGLVAAGLLHPAALLCFATLPLAVGVDRMLRTTGDWLELHDRGGKVRLFYLVNGIVLLVVAAWL